MLTVADVSALQLEKISSMLPTFFPGTVVTATVSYRYQWEKRLRVKTMTFWLSSYSELYIASFGDPYQRETMRCAERQLRRWHWKDRSGRVRRVKEILVDIVSKREEPTRTINAVSSRDTRTPLLYAAH